MYLKKTIILTFVLSVLLVACLPVANIKNTAIPDSINNTEMPSISPAITTTATPFPTMLPWPSPTSQTLSSFPEEYKYMSLNCKDFAEVDIYGLNKPQFMSISFDPVENLYVYDSANGQILIYDTEGGFIRTINLPNKWTEPLAYFPKIDVPVFDNKIMFSTGIAVNGKPRGTIIGTMNLDSGELGTFELPRAVVGLVISRLFFVDEQGMLVHSVIREGDSASNYFITQDGDYIDAPGGLEAYYKNSFIFYQQQKEPSTIFISKLDIEKKEFLPVKSIDVGTKLRFVSGVDKYNSMYIVLSLHKSPSFYMVKVSLDGEEKEVFQIPQNYFSENTETRIFVADSGSVFVLTIEDRETTAYSKIAKCHISENSE